jgi:hypothetical protein
MIRFARLLCSLVKGFVYTSEIDMKEADHA